VTSVSLNQVLWLYAWFPLATIIFLMLLIARFYENFSGDRTYYTFYLIPLVLFGGSAVRYASINSISGDLFGDIMSAAAGVVLITLSLFLFRLMVAGRKP
jgi:hypothetical protein